MPKKADVLVIGAGVLGAGLAYYLAREGIRVTVVEKGEVCSGTSSATAALVLPSPKTPKFYNELAWAGYERFKGLEAELGYDFELQLTGSTMLCRKPENAEKMKETIEVNRENGRTAQWLTVEEIAEREPILNPEAFCGGVYCAQGGNLNPFRLVNAYLAAAKSFGAEVCTFTEATGFETNGDWVRLVHTNKGDYRAETIICTAGNGTIRIGKMLGFDAHIKNTRGLILVSEKLPPILHSTYAEMRQSADGNILMGANFREMRAGDTDRRVYYDELQEVCADIAMLAPALTRVKIIRAYSGIRILPEDGFPIVGEVGGYRNFWMYAMHSAFSSSPELSWRLAQTLIGKMDREQLRMFAPRQSSI